MAKELTKFQAQHAALKTKYVKVKAGAAAVLAKQATQAMANIGAGESEFKARVAKARSKGVKGTTQAALAKDPGVSEGIKLLHMANDRLTTIVQAFDAYTATAARAQQEMAALGAAIRKDLSSRSSTFSESKPQIEALQATVETDRKAYDAEAKATMKDKVRKYPTFLDSSINKIISEAPAGLADEVELDELETRLRDRVINARMKHCVAVQGDVETLCKTARQHAGANDKSAAKDALSQATKLGKEVIGVAAEYQQLVTKYQAHINNSKDKNAILGAVRQMGAAADAITKALKSVRV